MTKEKLEVANTLDNTMATCRRNIELLTNRPQEIDMWLRLIPKEEILGIRAGLLKNECEILERARKEFAEL